MKSEMTHAMISMEKDVLDELVHEVKETVAAKELLDNTKTPVFGAADLWKIQRNMKGATAAYSRWNMN
ncbi:MAG: hypothetical protein J0L83_04265 [Chitinophagales bacterium]|jgi:hypothetical protein|nr:hypothetical protein [Chitinophagales bacterium]